MSRARALLGWFNEATNLRRFAFWNIWLWVAQQPLVVVWYVLARESFVNGAGILYIASISVTALWLSSLAWWQSTRVEERQIETESIS